ncbi:hypothetical protein [Neisseria sp.]|uniref:hypothetical protein n=1 Tax=Neisseria sp. TaxID=192066 RepID=UPI0035A06A9E
MKVIAYTGQYGNEIVTPLQAQMRKLSTVYSCHKPGERLEMHKTRRGQTHYFAYKGVANRTGDTAPETLTHTLCKQVIAELAASKVQTRLRFFNRYGPYSGKADEEIVFDGGDVEQRIDANRHIYIVDALCRFIQPAAPTALFSLERQWSGRLAFEIYHTSKLTAGSPKCRDLEAVGIPVIQIATGDPDSALYLDETVIAQMGEQDADRAISEHLDKLRRIFRKSIGGVVYNNPKSAVFAEAEKLYGEWDTARKELESMREIADWKNEEVRNLEEKLAEHEAKIRHVEAEHHNLTEKMMELVGQNNLLKEKAEQITKENRRLKTEAEAGWLTKLLRCFR